MALSTWRNRIVGHGDEDPRVIRPNPQNWRVHGEKQSRALTGILAQVGWVGEVMVNRRTGHLVDGHLRVDLAIQSGEARVPVTYVDLDDQEEALVLATLDPLGAMAGVDRLRLGDLLEQMAHEDQATQALLEQIKADAGLMGITHGPYDDRLLEEIDADTLPERPYWVLMAVPVDKMLAAKPLLEEIKAQGIRVEISDVG